jgi:hypothetical protein
LQGLEEVEGLEEEVEEELEGLEELTVLEVVFF